MYGVHAVAVEEDLLLDVRLWTVWIWRCLMACLHFSEETFRCGSLSRVELCSEDVPSALPVVVGVVHEWVCCGEVVVVVVVVHQVEDLDAVG